MEPRAVLLVPADPLNPAVDDPHFAPEAEAARARGLEVVRWPDERLDRLPNLAGAQVLWRGWMLRSEAYAALEEAILAQSGRLIVDSTAYRSAHELPGWLPAFTDWSAASWLLRPDRSDLPAALEHLGPELIVKDYVKSEKHSWDEACYVGRDSDAATVIQRFLELRGDDLVGGVVLRRFEHYRPGEARSWWVAGRLALLTSHPDSDRADDEASPPAEVLAAIGPAVAALGSPFVTVDLALRDDGHWRVVEVGDGQVSDRPRRLPADVLLGALSPLWSAR